MLITAKLRYAVMVMVHLAGNTSIPTKLSNISDFQSVPERYSEHVISALRKSGLVSAARGPGGGYYLNCSPKSVKISDILEAIGEEIRITRCDNNGIGCLKDQTQCKTHTLWDNLGNYIKGYFNKISLNDVLNEDFNISNNSSLDSNYVYADYNSTASIGNSVKENTSYILSYKTLNPSSVHQAGQRVCKILQDARDDICSFTCASDNKEILFTSSATEANNLAMKGMKEYVQVISAVEHPSIMRSVSNPYIISVDCDGMINLTELEKILCKLQGKKILVSVMMANNEIGVIQPIKEIAQISHKFGAICHTDAAQACGKIDVNMEDLGVDLLTLSAHKMGGLTGAGALIFDKNLQIEPIITGGGQEKGLRAGTENVIAIASFSSAVKQIPELLGKANRIEELRDQLESEILKIADNAIIFGKNVDRLPNTSCICMPGVKSDVQLMIFDTNNIAISSGAACSSGRIEPSYVLLAMGATKEQAECSIRISIGWNTTGDDIEKIINCWYNIYKNNIKLV
ncbi:aminotransferase class V-fold PLP-dependent enzyme [Candidatus Mesenet endosymbiont of Agriotes lineatus]|uniref:aminotransferase class V-fold PLP-dependent enzyme n=1 Tax=Candidatus Mesenet endosymbiont of Agriotes lineatus TaxID=3077948 RepID=UPI0030CD1E8E